MKQIIKNMVFGSDRLYNLFLPYIGMRPGKRVEFLSDYELGRPPSGNGRYCIVSDLSTNMGLFEMWMTIASKVIYAENMGYIPYIDLKNYKHSDWFGAFADKETNTWDIFFDQYQNNLSIEEVYSEKDHVLIKDHFKCKAWNPFSMDKEVIKCYQDIYKSVGVKKDVLREINKKKLPQKTLGVIIRRAFEYGNMVSHPLYCNWYGHHTRGHIDRYAEWLYDNLSRLGYNNIFLTTEDRETVDYFKKQFGNQCLNYDRKLCHFFINGKPVSTDDPEFRIEFKKKEDDTMYDYLTTVGGDYILETWLLSRCDAILKNNTGQQVMACIMCENEMKLVDNNLYLDMFNRAMA